MSPPNVETSVLRTLHRIHRQLADLQARLARGPHQIRAGQSYVAHQEQELAKAQEEAKTVRIATDAKQVQLKGAEDKIKDWESKLMSASSNREYQALKEQIAAQNMTNSVLDDEILEGWEKLEKFQKTVTARESDLAKARDKNEQVRSSVEEQEPLIRGDIERLTKELQENEGALPVEVKEPYRRVVRQRAEDSLAAVEDQCCGGCHQKVPLNVVAEIMLNRPMFCKTCGRMLYTPEEQ